MGCCCCICCAPLVTQRDSVSSMGLHACVVTCLPIWPRSHMHSQAAWPTAAEGCSISATGQQVRTMCCFHSLIILGAVRSLGRKQRLLMRQCIWIMVTIIFRGFSVHQTQLHCSIDDKHRAEKRLPYLAFRTAAFMQTKGKTFKYLLLVKRSSFVLLSVRVVKAPSNCLGKVDSSS